MMAATLNCDNSDQAIQNVMELLLVGWRLRQGKRSDECRDSDRQKCAEADIQLENDLGLHHK